MMKNPCRLWILCGAFHILMTLQIRNVAGAAVFKDIQEEYIVQTMNIRFLIATSAPRSPTPCVPDPIACCHLRCAGTAVFRLKGWRIVGNAESEWKGGIFKLFYVLRSSSTESWPGLFHSQNVSIHREAHLGFGLKLVFQASYKRQNFYMEN